MSAPTLQLRVRFPNKVKESLGRRAFSAEQRASIYAATRGSAVKIIATTAFAQWAMGQKARACAEQGYRRNWPR